MLHQGFNHEAIGSATGTGGRSMALLHLRSFDILGTLGRSSRARDAYHAVLLQ